jgi:hypothetical protein
VLTPSRTCVIASCTFKMAFSSVILKTWETGVPCQEEVSRTRHNIVW